MLGGQAGFRVELEWEPVWPLISVLFGYCRINCILVAIHRGDIILSIIVSRFMSTSLKNMIFRWENSAYLFRSVTQEGLCRCQGAISVSLFLILFLLCSSRSLGSRHASLTVPFIPGLPYIIWESESALNLPTCPGSSGVRANVNVRILVLLEKWWGAKMLAGWKCLDVQISVFFFFFLQG